MSDRKMDQLKDHEYDGIREYDNQLPRWWLGTFVLTVLFGLGYWFYYQVFTTGTTQEQRYQQALSSLQSSSPASSQPLVKEELLALMKDPVEKADAEKIFKQNCMACHGEKAGGTIGPNLTDDYWLHGGSPDHIAITIREGVTEKGMVAWKNVLSPTQVRKMVAYILSLAGSNPPNAKAPQGEKESD